MIVGLAVVLAVAGVVSLFFRMKSDSKAKNEKSRVVVVAVVLAVVIVVAMVAAAVVWTVAVAIAVMAVVTMEKEVAADTF